MDRRDERDRFRYPEYNHCRAVREFLLKKWQAEEQERQQANYIDSLRLYLALLFILIALVAGAIRWAN